MNLIKRLAECINLLLICTILISSSVRCEEFDASEVIEDIKENKVYSNDHIIINGDLYISEDQLTSLVIRNSQINGKLRLRAVTIENDLSFAGTNFNSDVEFDKVTVINDAKFENSTFNSDVDFDNVKIGSSANFKNCTFVKEVSFNNINKDLATKINDKESSFNFNKARFMSNVDFEQVRFINPVIFDNSRFLMPVNFSSLEINNDATFNKAIFMNRVNFSNVKFNGGDSDILSFEEAVFNNDLDFYASVFNKMASFDNSKINGHINFAGPTGVISANLINTDFSKDSRLIIKDNNIRINTLFIDEKYIDLENLSKVSFNQVLERLKDQDKDGKLAQKFNDKFIEPPDDTILKLFYLFDKYVLRWSTMDGVINVLKIFLISTLFIFPLFYLIRRCLAGPGNNDEENSSLMNRIYDCYYFSITNVLSQRSGDLKRRLCSWVALSQFILSAVLLFLIAYIFANRWLQT